ncbi:MAG: AMP-binding protein [bacterium]|nr:AMP-binding protein [bacterium]
MTFSHTAKRDVGSTFIRFEKAAVEQSISIRFEQQVEKYPHHLAISVQHYSLTYDQLNKAANRIARAIAAQPVDHRKPIALLFKHDVLAIVSMLGTLKTGSFYVILDPSMPQTRLIRLLEDSQTGLIVTTNEHFSEAASLVNLFSQRACRILNIDENRHNFSDENLEIAILPHAYACIIYTSGSTGQPKGVIQTHRTILHTIWFQTNRDQTCSDDRLILVSSLSFGLSIDTVFGALLNGATVFLYDCRGQGVIGLARCLLDKEITAYVSVPTLFRHFIATLTGEELFPRLRLIRLCGETVHRQDVELFKRHFSLNCSFTVSLATTEASTSCRYVINRETEISGNVVPSGYATEDKDVLFLDDDGRPVGLNQVGEIAVGSCYLSPGYWNDPELTRPKYLPDPEGGDKRIYLTGDLGRMRPDGCIEHLGRKDFQVKIRGYRVVLTEVEAALYCLEMINEAVVTAHEYESGDTYLVAYIVPSRLPAPTVTELRRILAETLPDYMIPTRFVFLETLPLTPTGKVDRQALPEPEHTRPELHTAFVPPRTSVEKTMAAIWTEVLNLEEVGIHDNFFALGGHSLLATRVISRICGTLKIDLSLRSLFEAPTVARLAKGIESLQQARARSSAQTSPLQDHGEWKEL